MNFEKDTVERNPKVVEVETWQQATPSNAQGGKLLKVSTVKVAVEAFALEMP